MKDEALNQLNMLEWHLTETINTTNAILKNYEEFVTGRGNKSTDADLETLRNARFFLKMKKNIAEVQRHVIEAQQRCIK